MLRFSFSCFGFPPVKDISHKKKVRGKWERSEKGEESEKEEEEGEWKEGV